MDDENSGPTDQPPTELQLVTESTPSDEEVRLRAYELFLARNGTPGSPEEDWVRAERELRRKQVRLH